ncbi:hypothetical protein C8J55DRAFT_505364, partial [Lentinula edodes]
MFSALRSRILKLQLPLAGSNSQNVGSSGFCNSHELLSTGPHHDRKLYRVKKLSSVSHYIWEPMLQRTLFIMKLMDACI